ncbi:unnamed protein product [Aphanomyces euteiches]
MFCLLPAAVVGRSFGVTALLVGPIAGLLVACGIFLVLADPLNVWRKRLAQGTRTHSSRFSVMVSHRSNLAVQTVKTARAKHNRTLSADRIPSIDLTYRAVYQIHEEPRRERPTDRPDRHSRHCRPRSFVRFE